MWYILPLKTNLTLDTSVHSLIIIRICRVSGEEMPSPKYLFLIVYKTDKITFWHKVLTQYYRIVIFSICVVEFCVVHFVFLQSFTPLPPIKENHKKL